MPGGRGPKQKGASGEYQVRDLMQPVVDEVYRRFDLTPPTLERNLEQTRHGGSDLVGLDWLAVEVKRHQDRAISQWWHQVKVAAQPQHLRGCGYLHAEPMTGDETSLCTCDAEPRIPVLVYRANNEPWRVVMFGYLVAQDGSRVRAPVDISVEAYLAWLRVELGVRVKRLRGQRAAFGTDQLDAVSYGLKGGGPQ